MASDALWIVSFKCNRRECILVLNGEADNSRFVMTEDDHRLISERLPALIAAELKRAKQEEKEKHKKFQKLRLGTLEI